VADHPQVPGLTEDPYKGIAFQDCMVAPLQTVANTVRILSDPTRFKILLTLANGPRNVTALMEELMLPQPLISHHLGLLRNAQAVTTARFGKRIIYSLAKDIKITNGSMQIGPVQIIRIIRKIES